MKYIFSILLMFLSLKLTFAQVSENWIARFTSDSIRNEKVNDMFVDSQGNIYLTGSQRQTSANFDIEAVTVKYNSQGVQQWIQNYRAPANNGAFGRAIHVDESGNIYITGENAIYSGGSNEALIIKYSPNGTQLWSNRFQYVNLFYAGGFDIITDATGNVYVTGEYGNGGNNLFLIKFNSDGQLVNQTFFNSSSEGGRKIALDGAGKIIISGYVNDNDSLSFIVLKYEQNLDLIWATRYGQGVGNQNIIDMAIDNNSNIIVAGTNSVMIDYVTIKIDPYGDVQWSKFYNSQYGFDFGKGVVVDDFGNIYVTGHTGSSGFPLNSRMTTIKYSSSGDKLWERSYSENLDGWDASDIAIDNASNVYVTGGTYNNSDIATIKYNTSGEFQWAITYNGSLSSSFSVDRGVVVTVDNNGYVYSAGNSWENSSNTGSDFVVIKYIQTPTSLEWETEIPVSYKLSQNYPNPFNPSTTISFSLPNEEFVSLKVFNTLGEEISELVNETKPAGNYEINFNAAGLSSGVYLYKLIANEFSVSKKMILIK